jgi:hypothetical protein
MSLFVVRHAHYFVKLFEYEYAQIFQNVNSVAKKHSSVTWKWKYC